MLRNCPLFNINVFTRVIASAEYSRTLLLKKLSSPKQSRGLSRTLIAGSFAKIFTHPSAITYRLKLGCPSEKISEPALKSMTSDLSAIESKTSMSKDANKKVFFRRKALSIRFKEVPPTKDLKLGTSYVFPG